MAKKRGKFLAIVKQKIELRRCKRWFFTKPGETKPGENLVPCPSHLEPCRRTIKRSQKNGNQKTGISVYSFFILAIFLCSPLSLKFYVACCCCCLMASRFHRSGVVFAKLFFPQFSIMDSKTVQRSAFCRSRRELSNAYFLANFGFDTAENEPFKVR